MKLLNVGCGSSRPADPSWINMDTLRACLSPDYRPETVESLRQLNLEHNYLEHDAHKIPWPFEDCSLDGILMNHSIEHFDCLEAVKIIKECRRLLLAGGVLRIGVPDAAIFRHVNAEDCPENSMRIFGEPTPPEIADSFLSLALFFWEHKQVFSEDSLWCHLRVAGFSDITRCKYREGQNELLASIDNRPLFTLFMEARK